MKFATALALRKVELDAGTPPSVGVYFADIASYGQFKDFQRSPLFGTNWQLSTLPQPYPFVFFRGIPAVFTGIFPIPGGNSADQATYTEELQLQGNSSDQRLTYQAGVYFEWSDPLALIGNQSSQLATCGDPALLENALDLRCEEKILFTQTIVRALRSIK